MILMPIAIGCAVVLQAGINRQLAGHWGLAMAIFVNSVVVLLAAGLVLALAKARPDLVSPMLRVSHSPTDLVQWRSVVAGLLGLLIILGLPWSFAKMGALAVILTVLVAQLAASLAWDAFVEGIGVSPLRVLGVVIALGGAVLANWRS